MNKKTFFAGAFVLFVSTFFVKLVGALYRIPLADILGGDGMGYYTSAFNIFTPVYAFCVAGLPVAVSKLVAQRVAAFDDIGAHQIVKTALWLFSGIGILGTAFLVFFADAFCAVINNPDAKWVIICLAPTIFFGAVSGVFRGAAQGRQNMVPTAVSQFIEACTKLICGVCFALVGNSYLLFRYELTGRVFSLVCTTRAEALSAIIPFTACCAMLGVTVSNAFGLLFLVLTQHGKKVNGSFNLQVSPVKQLLAIAFPVALSAVVINLSSLIDLVTIMRLLEKIIITAPTAFFASFKDIALGQRTPQQIPNFLYGSYSGVAMSVFHLVPSLTIALGISILPVVTTYAERRDKKRMTDAIQTVMRITAILSAPAGFGIAVLSRPILTLLYSRRPEEVAVAAPMLTILGVAAVFVAILIPINAIMQALGRSDVPVKIMLFGAAIKLALNYILISRPDINIMGASYATLVCYIILVVVSGYALSSIAGYRFSITRIFAAPFAAAAVSGLVSYYSQKLYFGVKFGNISVLFSIICGFLAYLLTLPLLGGIDRNDVLLLPFGKKIAKTLDFIGFMK